MNDRSWLKETTACADIPFQTYECSYKIYPPWKCKFDWEDDSKKEPVLVCIDKCLLPEILKLWEMGIKTTGCCCGHGKDKPFISVDFDDIQKMKDLGYEIFHNECRPDDEDSFIPKTVFDYQKSKCTEI
jgi:hypothetical protein